MKNHSLTLWGVLALFLIVMVFVVAIAFSRSSASCKIDPACLRQTKRFPQ